MLAVSFDSPYEYCKIPSIVVEDEDILNIILKYLTYFCPVVSKVDTFHNLQYHALRHESQYIILKDNKCIASCVCLLDLLNFMKNLIEKLVINTSFNDAQFFHGSAVVKNGICLCLIAPRGCGKSSLAFGLCQDGWGYVSDDLLLLHHNVIQPIPLPIELRKGIRIKSSFLSHLLFSKVGEKDVFLLPPTQEKVNTIRFVVLSNSNTSAIRKLTSGEAYFSLLSNLKVPYESSNLLKTLLFTAKKYVTYMLYNKDIYESLVLLDNLKNE